MKIENSTFSDGFYILFAARKNRFFDEKEAQHAAFLLFFSM